MTPNYQGPENTAQSLIQSQVDQARSVDAGQLAGGYLAGTGGADRIVNQKSNFDQNLSMSPMSQAIRSKFSQDYNRQKGALQREASLDAKNSYFQRLQSAADLVAREQQMNQAKIMAAYKAKKDKQAARGQLIGTILGIGGAAVGTAVGGPAGGMAGYSIGQGVGQSAGGA